jgi:hypothetical protein
MRRSGWATTDPVGNLLPVPDDTAPWHPTILDFAIGFDGFAAFGGFAKLSEHAKTAWSRWRQDGSLPADLGLLRALLYYEHRVQWHREESGGPSEPPPERFAYARALMSAIRATVDTTASEPVTPLVKDALVSRFREVVGEVLDEQARVSEVEQAVVPSIGVNAIAAALSDLGQGSGGELAASGAMRPKFHSVYSSACLVVNTFGRWRLQPDALVVSGQTGFTSLEFEARFPIFASRATPPNLDAALRTPGRLLAIESKLTEHLAGGQRARFAERYEPVVDDLLDPPWQQMYAALKADPGVFEFLNAAQLVKHALGLRRAAPGGDVTLLYLYWQPSDAREHPVFLAHAAEVARFAAAVEGSALIFDSLAYPALWRQWEEQAAGTADQTLLTHVQLLRARYGVSLKAGVALPTRRRKAARVGEASRFAAELVLETASTRYDVPLELGTWIKHWWLCAQYDGASVTEIEERIGALLALWRTPIQSGWERGVDRQLLSERYRRGDAANPHAGEHAIEAEVLAEPLGDVRFFAGAVLDGVNAVPLTRDLGGGRAANVEADLFLLAEREGKTGVFVVEVKDGADNAWHAVIENLLQLRLVHDSPRAAALFEARKSLQLPPPSLPHCGVVLAPRRFYERDGKKKSALPAAAKLIESFRDHVDVSVTLAVWDREQRAIERLSPDDTTMSDNSGEH